MHQPCHNTPDTAYLPPVPAALIAALRFPLPLPCLPTAAVGRPPFACRLAKGGLAERADCMHVCVCVCVCRHEHGWDGIGDGQARWLKLSSRRPRPGRQGRSIHPSTQSLHIYKHTYVYIPGCLDPSPSSLPPCSLLSAIMYAGVRNQSSRPVESIQQPRVQPALLSEVWSGVDQWEKREIPDWGLGAFGLWLQSSSSSVSGRRCR